MTSPRYEDTSPEFQSIDIKCYRGGMQSRMNSTPGTFHARKSSNQLSDFTLHLPRPSVTFDFESINSDTNVQLVFRGLYGKDVILVYYHGSLDASDLDSQNVDENVHCQIVLTMRVLIKDLQPTTVYTFCVFVTFDPEVEFDTPFQCKSLQTPTPFARQTWIYQEQKVIILTSFLMLLLVSLILGIVMTYLLIRRMPTLMKGSKRVVMVNNRSKDVMIFTGEASRNNSLQKEEPATIKAEAPIYLTPLPRASFDHGFG